MHPDIASVVKSKMAMGTSTSGDNSSKKNKGKIPKRIHKAEREKMQREHINELFLALSNSLELTDQSNGKAFVLIEATRMMKDMLDQIEGLRKEHAALLSESQYVTEEANELKDENSALEAHIGKLQTELKSRALDSRLDLNIVPPEYPNQELVMQPGQLQGHIVNPLHLAVFCSNIQAHPEFGNEQITFSNIPTVSKPHARYPTPTDTWPSQILEKQPELGTRDQHG